MFLFFFFILNLDERYDVMSYRLHNHIINEKNVEIFGIDDIIQYDNNMLAL